MNSNSKLKRKKKIHGPGNPSKRHRDRLNAELDNLARLLPFPEETVTKLDKISILRLTVSYLRAKSFFQVNGKNGQEETCEDLVREFEGNGLFSQLSLEALDGFIVVITQEGQLFYVSENVRDFLGYSQAAVIHQTIFKFLHIDDQDMVKLKLAWPNNVTKDTKTESEKRRRDSTTCKQENGKLETSEKLNRTFTCRMKCTLNHGGGFYKLFKLSGRLREIQTRKRDGDVVEYGLFAICSPAHNPNISTSASSVKKEVAITAQKRLERATSDPLGNRRNAYTPHAMMRPTRIGPFLYPDARAAFSPLASPSASSDSGHPSPVSSQTGKTGSVDQEVHSDVSELSSSSKSSLEVEAHERMYAASKARMHSYARNDRKLKSVSFVDGSQRDEDELPLRKRSRSLTDASELHTSDYDTLRRPYGTSLPPIAELKEDIKPEGTPGPKSSIEDSRAKTDILTRRPFNTYDSRLDAARGLVNLSGMSIPFPGLYPFPEFMYPDVMFPRLDSMSSPRDIPHMRSPFDVHNACCMGNDPCGQLAMRRWLSTPDMFRTPMNPLLAAQSGLLSPVDRMRYFQLPFPYGYPFPGPVPFDMATGLSERNLPEYAMRHRDGDAQTPIVKELAAEGKPRDRGSPATKTSLPSEILVKREKPDEERQNCRSAEQPYSPRKKSDIDESDQDMLNEDRGSNESGKTATPLRVSLTGIQAEFSSRLDNLNKSFTQSFGGGMEKNQDK